MMGWKGDGGRGRRWGQGGEEERKDGGRGRWRGGDGGREMEEGGEW
jgi:hypothetical protein